MPQKPKVDLQQAIRASLFLKTSININNLKLRDLITLLASLQKESDELKTVVSDKLLDNLKNIQEKLALIFLLVSGGISYNELDDLDALINDPNIDTDLLILLLELRDELAEHLDYQQTIVMQVEEQDDEEALADDTAYRAHLKQQEQKAKELEQQIQQSIEALTKTVNSVPEDSTELTVKDIVETVKDVLKKVSRNINALHAVIPANTVENTEDAELTLKAVEENNLKPEELDDILLQVQQATDLLDEHSRIDEAQDIGPEHNRPLSNR